MKIASSIVSLSSEHEFSAHYTKAETLKVVGNAPRNITNNNGNENKRPSRELVNKALSDYLELSKEATEKLKKEIGNSQSSIDIEDIRNLDIPEKDKQQLLLLAKMIKAITGKDLKISFPKDFKFEVPKACHFTKGIEFEPTPKANPVNWAAEYTSTETYEEKESLSFNANGIVNTSDGKQIQFEVNLNMSREFATTSSIDLRMGNTQLLDPLVINYDGPAASLTQTKFSFDIDSDGTPDQLTTLAKGSGFLAFDLNGDSEINNGNELFGTKSDNGFRDLGTYDADHNNWIDENDPVFSKLRIFSINEDGTRDLVALGEKGIGAIYLGNVGATFGMHDYSNKLQAQANSGGIFLRENGTAGLVQQIDYVV